MKITKRDAIEIARDAFENAGFGAEFTTGCHTLWKKDDAPDCEYYCQIHKQHGDNGDHFAVAYTTPDGETDFQYTKSLDQQELVKLLTRMADTFEMLETNELYAIAKDPAGTDGLLVFHVYPCEQGLGECDEEYKVPMFSDCFLVKDDDTFQEDWHGRNGLYTGFEKAHELLSSVCPVDWKRFKPDRDLEDFIMCFPDREGWEFINYETFAEYYDSVNR